MKITRERISELLYASLNVPMAFVHGPGMVIPALYAKYAGLSLLAIGSIMTFMRILDVVIDPMIGYLSDRTTSRFGRRKPWILAGAVLVCIGALLKFNPSKDTGYIYFAIANFVLILGWSMAEIPLLAWLPELTRDYQARSRMATQRFVATQLGNKVFLLLPLTGLFATTAITPQVTNVAAWIVVFLFVCLLPPALMRLPDSPAVGSTRGLSVFRVLRSVQGNPAFWHFVAFQSVQGLSSGIVGGLFYIWLDSYLNLADMYSLVMLPVGIISILGALFWLRVTNTVDKHRVVAACCLVTATANIAMYFIRPGESAFFVLLAVFSVTSFAGSGSFSAVASMLADTVDQGTLKTGISNSGNYSAVSAFVAKCCLAVGAGLGLIIAGFFGYTVSGPNDSWAMKGFFAALVFIPLGLNVLAAVLAWKFPISRKRQAEISRELEALQFSSPIVDRKEL